MPTAFASVVSAIVSTLATEPPVCANIDRARTRAVSEERDQLVNVQWEGAVPEQGAILGAPIDWTVRIAIDCYASSTQDTGDIAVDPLIEAVYDRLAADVTLGGVAHDLGVPAIEIDYTSGGRKTGWARMTYLVQLRTNDLKLERT